MLPGPLLVLALLAPAPQAELPDVLFLPHSAGFVHDVVKRPAPDALAPAVELFALFAEGRMRVTSTPQLPGSPGQRHSTVRR
jgi:hypothetical protein